MALDRITNSAVKYMTILERILIAKNWENVDNTWKKGGMILSFDDIGIFLFLPPYTKTAAGLAWNSLSQYLKGHILKFPNGEEIQL